MGLFDNDFLTDKLIVNANKVHFFAMLSTFSKRNLRILKFAFQGKICTVLCKKYDKNILSVFLFCAKQQTKMLKILRCKAAIFELTSVILPCWRKDGCLSPGKSPKMGRARCMMATARKRLDKFQVFGVLGA